MDALRKEEIAFVSGAGDWYPPMQPFEGNSFHSGVQSGFKLPNFLTNGVGVGGASIIGQYLIKPPEHRGCVVLGAIAGTASGIAVGGITRNTLYAVTTGTVVGNAVTSACNHFMDNKK